MTESPIRTAECQTFFPLGSGARIISSAPNAFFQVSIASAQPSTVSCGVTPCSPWGIAFGMLDLREVAHPTPARFGRRSFWSRKSAERGGDQAKAARQQPEHEQRVEQAGGRPLDGEAHQDRREGGPEAAPREDPAPLALCRR